MTSSEEHERWCRDLDKLQKQNKRIEVLEGIIKNALTSLAIIQMPVQRENLGDVATNNDLLKIMADSFRQALGFIK
ncbi:hypothetical protein LCGC14_2516280 [marine sediment metagenome]|uniref:Uncharacterized protein n=1 Tax=marine sediment metagenome TaxID=412755 RepID=A0A0F9DR33_9ZZZZ